MTFLEQTTATQLPTLFFPGPTKGEVQDRNFRRLRTESAVSVDASVARKFRRLANKWIRQTRHLSAPSQKYLHPSYARIIGLGQCAVPFILKEIQQRSGDWFYALRAITGDDPVSDDMAGDIGRMSEAWLQWGRARRYL
jgi:hypothetical protein